MNKEQIIEQYKVIEDYHKRYLAKRGVKLPKLWANASKTTFTKDAIALAVLSRDYPRCRSVSKAELTRIMQQYYPDVNDVQQARHLGAQKGWYIESGTRGDVLSSEIRPGEYLLKTLEEPLPGFSAERREFAGDFDELKQQYDYRCACCGSKEGEPHRYMESVKTVLQKGHMDPSKPLVPGNIIPQCSVCNRPDRNWWVYDAKGRVVGVGSAYVLKRTSEKVKREMYETLKLEFGDRQ